MRRLGRRLPLVALALAALLVLPDVAHACPVCFDSSDENRQAFLVTTALLSLLPLGMVGGVGLWLRRRAREAGQGEPGSERPTMDGQQDG